MRKKSDIQEESSEVQSGKLSEKVGRFFHTDTQKEKVLRYEDFNAAGDVYYAGVSAVYKVAQRILWLLFVLFLVISILLNYSVTSCS